MTRLTPAPAPYLAAMGNEVANRMVSVASEPSMSSRAGSPLGSDESSVPDHGDMQALGANLAASQPKKLRCKLLRATRVRD
jgi:hypothetical protein